MNFDDIKDAWNNDQENENIKIPAKLDQLKSAQLPVERLRKGMKSEFWVQCLVLVIVGFTPKFFYLQPQMILPFYALYSCSLVVSIYYFFKLYVFYKRIGSLSLTSKDNLYELYYEARLSIEVYKSFTYMLVPFFMVMAVLLFASVKVDGLYQRFLDNETLMLMAAFSFANVIALIILMTEIWIKYGYGKYIKQIKAVLDEFKE
ncbi:hypothetical protein DVR12_16095 [Chitinophaga silvatica]|uniref:Uncharacterized protein n=1 Tax=Chitinophaga silvatica TaxID=2282649 RepID=A0A3E1Y8C2_9BACT|nr:hypothetical protein [Chitinophaga silvatica]RFS21418.1 hypothetical protein DVR12_16095 [Chitinophaga silvatica]